MLRRWGHTNDSPTSPEQPAEEPQHFYSTTDVPDGYNTGVVNERNNNLYFIADENGNGTGNVKRVNFVLNNGGEDSANGVAIFSGNKMRSMTINSVTYTFSQNADNKVDVAVTRDNVTELYTNVADASLIDIADSNNKLAAAFLGIGNTQTSSRTSTDSSATTPHCMSTSPLCRSILKALKVTLDGSATTTTPVHWQATLPTRN